MPIIKSYPIKLRGHLDTHHNGVIIFQKKVICMEKGTENIATKFFKYMNTALQHFLKALTDMKHNLATDVFKNNDNTYFIIYRSSSLNSIC